MMTIRRYGLGLGLLVWWSIVATPTASASSERPNILWITVEDLSPHLGCYGDTTVPTPNLDALAAQGVRYTNAYGVYGVCAPNRHAIILGMYPTTTGAMAMRTYTRTAAIDQITDPELLALPTYEATPPPEAKCFPEYLRAAGYYCTNNSKTDYQFRDPLVAWNDSSRTAHWRNRSDSETPFFAVFNLGVTHESRTFNQRSPRIVDPSDVSLPPYYPDAPLVRRDLARHYDNIAAMDTQVGKILGELQADGLDDETIVLFFSDHGDGLPRSKRWVYDSGIHVPLLVRYPHGQDAGNVNEELVSFVDLAPTMLSLAGLDVPDHMQGHVFFGDNRDPSRDYIYAARDRMDPAFETIRAVRDKRFKYVRNFRPDLPYIGFIPYRNRAEIMQEILRLREAGQLGLDQWQFWATRKPMEELYDTEDDPHEIHNLAASPEYFGKLAELRKELESWRERTGDLGLMPESELIKHLWPPDGEQPTTGQPEISIMLSSIPSNSPNVDDLLVSISCPTEGASVGYRLDDEEVWRLYVKPFRVSPGMRVTAQAHRLGWKRSPVISRDVMANP